MSNQKGFLLFIGFAFLLAIGLGILRGFNKAETEVFNGEEITFSLKDDWVLKIQSDGEYSIEIASPYSFLLDGEGILLSGDPTEPPLNYGYEYYYHYENDFEGSTEWVIVNEQNADIKITGERNLSCTFEPTKQGAKDIFTNSILGSFLLWLLLVFVALLIML
jgi:hypothetical protein